MKLSNLDVGDLFRFASPWSGFAKEDVFVFCGRTDVFVYGPNVFDVCPEHQEDNFFSVEDQEVIAC